MYDREKILETMREIKSESDTIKPYIVLLQPRRLASEVSAQSLDGTEGLHVDTVGYSRGFANIFGEKVDVARNYLLEQAVISGAKYALFVGEDTVLPYDGFIRLHETAEANPNSMVVGVYYVKLSSPMIHVKTGDWIVPADVTPGKIIDVYSSGLDCALIPISILIKLKESDPELPFCCIGYHLEEGLPFVGEDNFFTFRLKKAGFKILCNTDVQCLHMDLESGKYTAHPDIKLENYLTNIPMTGLLTMQDKLAIDKRWVERLPDGSGAVK